MINESLVKAKVNRLLTPLRFAEAAEKALRAAGAKVRFQRYEGGHGWHGDIWTSIREGISWLDRQASAR